MSTSAMVWIVILLLVFLVVAFRPRTGRSRKGSAPLHDRSLPRNMDALPLPAGTIHARPLLSSWEKVAIDTFARQLPPGYRLCSQVRLLDMLTVQDDDRSRQRTTRNRLGSKSVDFAVIDSSGHVAVVIELNDKSHDRPDRQDRDKLVGAALAQAGIPLAVFHPRQALDLAPWFGQRTR